MNLSRQYDDFVDAEDNKLVVLARATRARTGAVEGAALRDLDGRTYAAATVDLPSLKVSAIGVAVAMAVASGAKGAEAVVVLTEGDLAPADLAVLVEFAGPGVHIHRGTPAGTIVQTLES
ncbi:MAG: cytidine deaminase [Marmoricola sp.]|nr:cytidine deaminase [Marmoricola sp.]